MKTLCTMLLAVAFLAPAHADEKKPPKLPVTGVVTVHAMDLFGSPLADFSASYLIQGQMISVTQTDQDGNFKITGLQVNDVFGFTVYEDGWVTNGWYDQNYQGDWTYYLFMIPTEFLP